jgi:hypothetical protein
LYFKSLATNLGIWCAWFLPGIQHDAAPLALAMVMEDVGAGTDSVLSNLASNTKTAPNRMQFARFHMPLLVCELPPPPEAMHPPSGL